MVFGWESHSVCVSQRERNGIITHRRPPPSFAHHKRWKWWWSCDMVDYTENGNTQLNPVPSASTSATRAVDMAHNFADSVCPTCTFDAIFRFVVLPGPESCCATRRSKCNEWHLMGWHTNCYIYRSNKMHESNQNRLHFRNISRIGLHRLQTLA